MNYTYASTSSNILVQNVDSSNAPLKSNANLFSLQAVHVDANSLALNVHDDSGRVVVMQHGQGFASQMTRYHRV